MTSGVLVQILFDLLLLASVAFLWVKMHRPQKDDPRLSRGLQLLQSKIAVLEDLSDQIENQVQQIMALMDSKGREMQNHLMAADKQIQKIGLSMEKSLDVAKIFQDRIPHQEIIERQNTIKYVKAARMAHQGSTIEEIAEEVDLSRGELEMIAKVNREQLQFSEEDLPEWAKEEENALSSGSTAGQAASATAFGMATGGSASGATAGLDTQALTRTLDRADISLSTLGEKFRQAIPRVDQEYVITPKNPSVPHIEMPAKSAAPRAASVVAPVDNRTATSKVVAPPSATSRSAAFANARNAAVPASPSGGSTANSTAQNSQSATSSAARRVAATTQAANGPATSTSAQAPVSNRAQTTTGKSVEVQKVVFPRIDMTQHLS